MRDERWDEAVLFHQSGYQRGDGGQYLGIVTRFELNWYLRNAPAIQPYEKFGF